MKKSIFYVIYFVVIIVTILIIIELFFRLLPVSNTTNTKDVDEKNPYIHFEPNRDLQISFGNLFQIKHRKRVNNYGYFNDFDFNLEDNKIVIIGDSYVEAIHVENRFSIGGILDKKISSDYGMRVYSIGISGSPLSQYLAFSEMSEVDRKSVV